MIKRYAGIEVHEAPDGDMIDYEDHVKSVNTAAMNAYMYLFINVDKKMAEEVSQIILEAGR